MDRQPKKSEKLEVRLPYGEKVRFLDRVTAHGQSVNQVLRTLIKDYSDRVIPSTETPRPRLRIGRKPWVLGGLLLVGVRHQNIWHRFGCDLEEDWPHLMV